jgi:lipopolysaccharide/colanic/teichoic acid biosynthesis glycosyltransferase
MSTNLPTSSFELEWSHSADRSACHARAPRANAVPMTHCSSGAYATALTLGRNQIESAKSPFVFPKSEVPAGRLTTRPNRNSNGALTISTSGRTSYDSIKRALDIVGASVLLLVLAPVIAAIALLVRLDSRGPVIFSQKRLTEGGKVFTMFKFRTMRTDAESATGAIWASKADPRVTSIGKYLRLFRFDELPQLVNVLRGEMSLIGPRPERPEIAVDLSKELRSFNRRLAVKAGITGLAQTTTGYASSVESYRKKLAWDILYVQRRSLLLDLRIAVKTIFVVFTGSGAR